jgi:hypothetical protein
VGASIVVATACHLVLRADDLSDGDGHQDLDASDATNATDTSHADEASDASRSDAGDATLDASSCDGGCCCAQARPPTYSSDVSSTASLTSAGTAQGGYPTANAFDSATNDLASTSPAAGIYFGQCFDTPRNIRRVAVYRGVLGTYPFRTRLQFADATAGPWQDTNVDAIDASLETEWKSFDVNDYGAHSCWRFLDTGGTFLQVQEIDMFEEADSGIVCGDC